MKEFARIVLASNGEQVVVMIEATETKGRYMVNASSFLPSTLGNQSCVHDGSFASSQQFLAAFDATQADKVIAEHNGYLVECEQYVRNCSGEAAYQEMVRRHENTLPA